MKWLVYLLFITIFCVFVSAATFDVNVTYNDGLHTYQTVESFVADSLSLDNNEMYISGVPFCDTPYTDHFITNRDCPVAPPVSGGGSTDQDMSSFFKINQTAVENQQGLINETNNIIGRTSKDTLIIIFSSVFLLFLFLGIIIYTYKDK